MKTPLSPQQKLEKAFSEDEFEFAEDAYRTAEELAPTPRAETLFGGEIGMVRGESLELAGDGDNAAAACRESGDDALFEEFFHD